MKLTLEKTIQLTKNLKYCLEILSKKNAPPTFSHGEGRWGKDLNHN